MIKGESEPSGKSMLSRRAFKAVHKRTADLSSCVICSSCRTEEEEEEEETNPLLRRTCKPSTNAVERIRTRIASCHGSDSSVAMTLVVSFDNHVVRQRAMRRADFRAGRLRGERRRESKTSAVEEVR